MSADDALRHHITATVAAWRAEPPTRTEMMETADTLADWRRRNGATGLWAVPPQMVTATVDDAMGHGLDAIHRIAHMAGIEVHHLGLLVPAAEIVAACRRLSPAMLGVTLLQFDSEPVMAEISAGLPPGILFTAGGPLFRADPDLAVRCGIHRVFADAAAFAAFLLEYHP
jgi:methylmalonyl-CoA mutase cobalamin-binding subunit